MSATLACVWTGTKYGPEYVRNLASMARRHGARDVICLTDRPHDVPAGVEAIDIRTLGLEGWWAKMALFSPLWRGDGRVVYLDLDTVICGPLGPLFDLDVDFGICANFARAAGAVNYPCRYGSCVMTFADGWGGHVFSAFMKAKGRIMARCGRYGDQKAIEELVPEATLLQGVLPKGYFLNKRDLAGGPGDASILIFGGRERPHNTPHRWAKEHWT